jgi:hypothetical protein
MFRRGANVLAMKERYSKAEGSITWRSRQSYRRWTGTDVCRDRQLQDWPIRKTARSERKISIRWEKPEGWGVHVRAARQLKVAGV